MSAAIQVRGVSPTYDPLQGNNTACFVTDVYAVAQIIQQRLLLFQGEWWENLNLGLPLFQSILGQPAGQRSQQVMMMLILAQINSCPYVLGVVSSDYTYSNRTFYFTCVVQTKFGTITVTNYPVANAQQAATS